MRLKIVLQAVAWVGVIGGVRVVRETFETHTANVVWRFRGGGGPHPDWRATLENAGEVHVKREGVLLLYIPFTVPDHFIFHKSSLHLLAMHYTYLYH